ncbi:MAG: hypothetical protein H0X73_10420 [Chthoniobacterales bacterium]|nr:hypothetical protein [Chthoniobacterales bacterium]
MAEDDRKRGGSDTDPARLAQLLEVELIQKRAAWQRAAALRGTLRMLSFLFVFIVIAGALLAFFVFFSFDSATRLRSNAARSSSAAASQP